MSGKMNMSGGKIFVSMLAIILGVSGTAMAQARGGGGPGRGAAAQAASGRAAGLPAAAAVPNASSTTSP